MAWSLKNCRPCPIHLGLSWTSFLLLKCYIFASAFQKFHFTKQYFFPSLLKDVWLGGYWSRSPNVLPLLSCLLSKHVPGRCARSEGPKLYSRLMLLLSPESALVTRFSLLLPQTVKVTSFCWYESAIATRISLQLLLKLSKLPVFLPATSLPCYQTFAAVPTAQDLPLLPDPLSACY